MTAAVEWAFLAAAARGLRHDIASALERVGVAREDSWRASGVVLAQVCGRLSRPLGQRRKGSKRGQPLSTASAEFAAVLADVPETAVVAAIPEITAAVEKYVGSSG